MPTDPPAAFRMRFQLAAFSLTRTVLNTSFRMIYPFLPVFARGLGVDLSTIALAVTARSSVGLASPFLGSLADRHGRKWTMLVALGLFSASMALVTGWPIFSTFVAALILSTVAKVLFDPAMQAYLGDRVHYARRGLVIAVTEIGWSGAFLVGVPLAGWVIQAKGWAGPFPWLAALGVCAALLLSIVLPADKPAQAHTQAWRSGLQSIIHNRSALAGLTFGILVSLANEVVNIVFGVWLERAFGLQVVALGAASAVIGLSELGGESLVAGLSDRLGKRKAVAWGVGLNSLACMALPLLDRSLPTALTGLFLSYITFEFTLVSAIPLMTELAPAARGMLMGSNIGGQSAGRAVGALIGPALFGSGLIANASVAAGFDLLALALLILFVRE
jgi:predicted MFS family arabinose efflux permease